MKKHAIFADRLMMNFMNVWIVGKLYATTVQCKLANIVSVKIASNDFVVWGMCVSAAVTVFYGYVLSLSAMSLARPF